MGRKAFEHGKHVLCEKPLTPTAAEAAQLVALSRDRKLCLMDGFMWPHHPRTADCDKCSTRTLSARCRRVNGAFTFRMALDKANIRLQADMAGGSLLDVGCYPVYGIRWAFQAEPVRVWPAPASSRRGRRDDRRALVRGRPVGDVRLRLHAAGAAMAGNRRRQGRRPRA